MNKIYNSKHIVSQLMIVIILLVVMLSGCSNESELIQFKTAPVDNTSVKTMEAPTITPTIGAKTEIIIDDNNLDEDNPTEEQETKEITSEQAVELARQMFEDGENYHAVYWKQVEYNDKSYYLINIQWKVDDGDGKFHYSHIGYVIVSLDGSEVLNADYLNDQVQVY